MHEENTSEIWSLEITKDEVLDHIVDISDSKSSGFTSICSKLLKMVLKIIIDQFTTLLNLILSTSIFPSSWKVAITTVIPKPGNTCLVGNLRPISLLPVTGKIMEKIINFIIMDYLESQNKLFDRQGGFRKGRSTVKTAHDLVNHILINRNKGMTSAAVFIDIAKAFNCINHVLLLNKLKALGFPCSLVGLVESYLADRKQIVKLNGHFSDEDFVTDGIPQGSNLGPTLFLVYINDLMNIKFRGFLNLFAEDSCIAVSNNDTRKLCEDLNHDLKLFHKWCVRNRLTINVNKTKIVVFKKNKKSIVNLGNVYLNGQIVQPASEYVYLGFVLDENLSFHNHAKKLLQASNTKVYTLAKIRRFINCDTAVIIFKSFILPKIEYGDIFCCGLTKKMLQKLQVVMNRALRICFKSKREDSNYENHLKAKVLPLHIRQKSSILRLMFARSRTECSSHNAHSAKSPRITRTNSLPYLECPFPRTETFKKSISYTGPRYWEILPGRLKILPNLKSFKNEVKKYHRDMFIEDGFV